MKLETLSRNLLLVLASILAVAHPLRASAEDIDIFVAGEGGSAAANVLIILDNTSNWAAANQKWPAPDKQGQAELKAIAKVLDSLDDSINVGLMMFTNNGQGNCCNGGYIRSALRPMTQTNRDNFKILLNDIVANFNDPDNQAASSATPAMVLFDAFKYFGGYWNVDQTPNPRPKGPKAFDVDVFASPPSAYPASKADRKGYADDALTKYLPPASTDDACDGRNFIIYIGNGWEPSDTLPQQDMKAFLEGVGGDSGQIALKVLSTTTSTAYTVTGTSACFKNNASGLAACNAAVAGTCGAGYDTCTCSAPTTGGCTPASNVHYTVSGGITTTEVKPTGGEAYPDKTTTRYADEWTRFLQKDADVSAAPGQQNVTTYAIDVFNAQQNADQTALLYSMSRQVGGGEYYAAKSQAEIEAALGSIFAQIRADNSTFASASLPVSATNRALNVNEVYMGIFRPDADRRPTWYGNLKRYKIANFNGDYKLADINGLNAVDTVNTGFIVECAISWWTNDSGKYWADIVEYPSPKGGCPPTNTSFDPFSDAPDGPKVEKGGVAEILRQGNDPSVSATWALNRTTYTKAFVPFNTTNSGMTAADVDFVNGLNIDPFGGSVSYTFVDPSGTSRTTSVRSTIHGGVVHSRPLPVNYGGSTGTILYYGSDDGFYRAVDAATGKERWAYVPEEFYPTLPRLRQNSPKIQYSFMGSISDPTPPTPKNYHFDGSTGLWQRLDGTVWIYPTMRRGGRMVHAFNVSNPASPSLKWKKGCSTLTDDTGCNDADYTDIGQTWSTPNVANVNVDGSVKPVLVMGAGYDNCEDGAPAAACAGAKGSAIFVIDANDGKMLRSFTTAGRVASDVALIDIDYDGVADYGYVGDTRGNLHRISFGPSKTFPLAMADWTSTIVAKTSGGNRKFLNAPALVQGYDKCTNKTFVYVALGSGDREQPLLSQYPYAQSVQNRFYVYLDDVTATSTTNLDTSPAMNNVTVDPGCGNQLVIPCAEKTGWFMDLPNRGEQTVTSAIIVGGLVAFSTNAAFDPEANPNVCAPKGIARGYVVNLFNGSGGIAANNEACGGDRSSVFAGGGLPPSPVVANVEVDGKVQTIVIGVADLKGGASSGIQSEVGFTMKPQKRTRMYWRQEGNN